MLSKLDDMQDRFDKFRQDFKVFGLGLPAQSFQSPTGPKQLEKWLKAFYTDDEYDHSLRSRLEGTCDWFLQREQFQTWMATHAASEARILWIHGPPGFGKTILTARLIHHLRQIPSLHIASFFCKSETDAGRHPTAIVRSWVAQLINEDLAALEAARKTFHGNELRTATESDVWKLFRAMSLGKQNYVFVVDGFDECIKSDLVSSAHATNDRTAFLRNLIQNAKNTGIRILIVSRNESDICYQLGTGHAKTLASIIRFFEYEIATEDTKGDIQAFASSIIGEELSNKSKHVRNEISETAADKSHGMFLWVELLRKRLSRGKTTQQLRDTVGATPIGLNQAYERDLKWIAELETDRRIRAIGILRWTLFAIRPLTIGELTEALMTEVLGHFTNDRADDSPNDWDQYYANEQIRDLCGSLIEFRGQEGSEPVKQWTIHFVHSSVREYLLGAVSMNDPILNRFPFSNITSAQIALAKVCLQYLCSDVLHGRRDQEADDVQKLVKEYQFLEYASRHWFMHAKGEDGVSKYLQPLIDSLLEPKASRWTKWSEVFESKEGTYEHHERWLSDNHASSLYYACLLGLTEAVKKIQSQVSDPNVVGGKYGSPLQAAAVNNHRDLVILLLENGANVNIFGGEFGNAIVGAAATTLATDSSAVVQILLAKGADTSKTDGHGRTALFYAAMRGKTNVVRLLLSYKADSSIGAEDGDTPLHSAAFHGHEEIVKLLLKDGNNVNITGRNILTPLHYAAINGYETIAKLLLESGARFTAGAIYGVTPLHCASLIHGEIVQLLLDFGADVNHVSDNGSTPLHITAEFGNKIGAQALLIKGADVAMLNENGESALHVAAQNGQEGLVSLLLDHRAEVDLKSEFGLVALHYAASAGHEKTVKILLDSSANLNALDNSGRTSLHNAAFEGRETIVKLLLGNGADIVIESEIDCSGNYRELGKWTALRLAGWMKHESVARLLLDAGARLKDTPVSEVVTEAINRSEESTLRDAAWRGNGSTLKLLLDFGTDVEATTENGMAAIHFAAQNGHGNVIQQIIAAGAETNVVDDDGWSPLHFAALDGHKAAVMLLLGKGWNMDTKCRFQRTALHCAAQNGHKETLIKLVEAGATVNSRDRKNWTALHLAAHGGHTATVQALVDFEAATDADDWTALHFAAQGGHLSVVEILATHGKILNVVSKTGLTALHLAIQNRHETVVASLLRKGIETNVQSMNGRTPLHLAVEQGQEMTVDLLLNTGVDLNVRTKDGVTALMLAALKGNDTVSALLIKHGGDITATNAMGQTALHTAAGCGHLAVIARLLDAGANPNLQSRTGLSALHEVLYGGRTDAIPILLSHGANPLLLDIYGRSCLDWVSLHPPTFDSMISLSKNSHAREPSTDMKILVESIVRLADCLNLSENRVFFHHLGHCLLLVGDISNAEIAFEQYIYDHDTDGKPLHALICSDCNAEGGIKGDRFVCRSCPNMDLCSSCMEHYVSVRTCQNHQFLKISRTDRQGIQSPAIVKGAETMDRWLEGLVKKYKDFLVQLN